jgi:hypothetical protein
MYFRQTGAYAQILSRILAHDFLQFGVVFLVILLAFSGSFYLSLRGDKDVMTHIETRQVNFHFILRTSVYYFGISWKSYWTIFMLNSVHLLTGIHMGTNCGHLVRFVCINGEIFQFCKVTIIVWDQLHGNLF